MNPFMPKLLAIKAEFYARRQLEIAAHHPRLQPNGLPLVFADGDAASGYPAWLYSRGQDGRLMRIGRLVAVRTPITLKVLDVYVFHDLDRRTYVPAVIAYLCIEADLFGLDRIEVVVSGATDDRQRLLAHLEEAGYQPTPTGSMLKTLGPSRGAA